MGDRRGCFPVLEEIAMRRLIPFYILTLLVVLFAWRKWETLPVWMLALVALNVLVALVLTTWKVMKRR